MINTNIFFIVPPAIVDFIIACRYLLSKCSKKEVFKYLFEIDIYALENPLMRRVIGLSETGQEYTIDSLNLSDYL